MAYQMILKGLKTRFIFLSQMGELKHPFKIPAISNVKNWGQGTKSNVLFDTLLNENHSMDQKVQLEVQRPWAEKWRWRSNYCHQPFVSLNRSQVSIVPKQQSPSSMAWRTWEGKTMTSGRGSEAHPCCGLITLIVLKHSRSTLKINPVT